jgi:F-type H+-transporting ATPase subunit c
MSLEVARVFSAAIALLSLFGIGIGLGNFFSSWISSVTRNPESADKVKLTGFIGMALIEFLALLTFAIALMILRAK